MQKQGNISLWVYELALVTVTVLWGGSFIVLKGALDSMSPGWLLTLRFALAAMVLCLLFLGRIRSHLDVRHVYAGLLIGIPEGLGFLVQNVGLVDTTPGRNAFLTGTYCVMVPFLAWMLVRRRPSLRDVLCALICLAGIGFVSLRGDLGAGLSRGDILTLMGAVFFALNILCVEWFGRGCDFVTITFVELATMTLVCLAWSLAAERPPVASDLLPGFFAQLAYVVFASTMLCMLLQNVAQQHVPSGRAALLMSLESVFATIFSITFYGERLTVPVTLGFTLILVSVVLSQMTGGEVQEVVA